MTFVSKEVLHQTLAVATISLNVLHEGIGDAWTAPTIYRLKQPGGDLHFTDESSSWVASAAYMGFIVGSSFSALLLDVLGRRCIATACAFTFVIVWLGIAFSRVVWLIYCMRFLWGLSNGATTGVDSFYIGEVTSPNLRGVFVTVYQCLYYTGLCGEYVIVTYLSYKVTALVNTSLALLTVVSALWMVESPHYLLLRGKPKQAERNFLYLKGITELGSFADEFQRIKENVQFEKMKTASYKTMLTSSMNVRTLLVIVLLHCLTTATGYAPILNFCSFLFSSTKDISQEEFTILFGVSQFLFSLLALLIIERYNRRTVLRVAYVCIAFNQIGTGILLYVNERVTSVPYFPWLIFASINVYFCIIALAYPAIFALRGELLPLSIKAFGGFAISSSKSVVNFALCLEFLQIKNNFGMYVNFVMYSAVSIAFVVFLYFCVPETRNKSLTRIQDDLHKKEPRHGAETGMSI